MRLTDLDTTSHKHSLLEINMWILSPESATHNVLSHVNAITPQQRL